MANEIRISTAALTWAAVLSTLMAVSQVMAGPLQIENGRFVDQEGGDVVLRGFNLSQWHKIPPFQPNQDPALFAKLSQMGVNAVRLQFNWEAYETAPGVYDERYLDYYAGVVQRASAQNVYVIVDMHQDAFSRWTLSGCGEGFPKWAIPAGTPVVTTPDNGKACATWPVTAIWRLGEMNRLFNAFMATGNWAREHYMVVLERLARRFAGKPNVIGFEPLNEPFGSGAALVQLHRDAAARIRAIDPSAIIFVCPEMWAGLGLLSTAITDPALKNLVFAPHYYDPLVSFKMWAGGRYEPHAKRNRERAKAWGAAVVLGEFGAPPSAVAPPYLDMIYDDLEKFGESGLQWGYTPEWRPATLDGFNSEDLSVIDDKGRLRNNFTPRPYVRRTAGAYGQWQKREAKSAMGTGPQVSYSWAHEPALGVTELFLPATYFGGMAVPHVMVSPRAATCALLDDGQVLRCTSSTSGKVTVTVN